MFCTTNSCLDPHAMPQLYTQVQVPFLTPTPSCLLLPHSGGVQRS